MPINAGDTTAEVKAAIDEIITASGLDPDDNVDTTAATAMLNEIADVLDLPNLTNPMAGAAAREAINNIELGAGGGLIAPTNIQGSWIQFRKLYNHVSRAIDGEYVTVGWLSDSTVVLHHAEGRASSPTDQLADILDDMGITARSDNYGGNQGAATGGTMSSMTTYFGGRLTAPETIKKGRQVFYTDTLDANPLEYTPTKPYDRIKVQYRVNSSQGTLQVYDDGGTLDSFSTSAGAFALANRTIDRPTLDADPFTIERASGGSVFIYLVHCYDSTVGGLNFLNLAQSGWSTSDAQWSDGDGVDSPLKMVENWALDCYIIKLGKNDKTNGRTIDQYKTGIQAMIDAALTGNPNASIILEITEPSPVGSTYNFDADWKQAVRDVATANGGLIVVDTYANYGSYEKNPTQYVDVVHPNAIGARREAELFAELFAIGRDVRPSWVSADALGAADFENQKFWRFNYDYSRSGAAVAANDGGTFDAFASGAVRITDKGVWIEPARTSFLASPANIKDGAWGADGGEPALKRTLLSGGPIGGQNATSVEWISGNGRILQNRNFVNGQQHHCMAIVKPGTTARYAYFRIPIGAATFNNYVFDLISGTVGLQGSGSTNAKITPLDDGYFLIEFDWLCAITVTQTFYFLLTNNAVANHNFTAPTSGMDTYNVAYIDMLTAYGEASPVVASPRAADALTFKDAAGSDLHLTYSDDTEETISVSFPYDVPSASRRIIKFLETEA